jgi:hypothetical protein
MVDSSDEEIHHMDDSKDCGIDLEEVRASESFALSSLRQPQAKCQKTHHLTPVTTAFIDVRLGKTKLHKARVLLDTGSSSSLIVNKLVKNLHMKIDVPTTWTMQAGIFCCTPQKSAKYNLY